LFLLLVYGPAWAFFLLVSGIVVLGLREYYQLVGLGGEGRVVWAGVGFGWVLCLAFFLAGTALAALVVVLMLLVFVVEGLVSGRAHEEAVRVLAAGVLGVFYVGWLLSYLVWIRALPNGERYIIILMLAIWCGDTAAYYWGSAFGKRKLAPRISPGKTVEGAGACVVGALAGALLARWWFLPHLPLGQACAVGLLTGVIGQVGDASESVLKRRAGVKDSGALIPGHGGVLDRVDSILFAAPAVYYLLTLLGAA
jgi:phosphatidate cytidylyltransferase